MISIKAVLKNIFSKDIILISIILFVSLFPRLWKLESLPSIIVDEPAYLRDIEAIVNQKPTIQTAGFQWDWSQSTIFYYPTILTANFLGTGPSIYVLRLVSVFFSLFGLVAFYLIAKNRFDKPLAFIVTILFSFSYYYLQFSRVGWGVIYTMTLGLYYLYFLEMAFRKKHWLWFSLSGFIGGLVFYGYRSAEVYLAVGFLFLFTNLFQSNDTDKKKVSLLFIFIGTFLITTAPWLCKISQNWELYNLRQRVVSIFNTKPYHGMIKTDQIIKYQIITTFRSWILLEPIDGGGIENPRYLPLKNSPANIVIRLLFIVGLFLSLKQLKTTYVWWFIFIFGLIFGQILTVDPPNGARGLILLPIIYFFAALTLEKIYNLCNKNIFILSLIIVISLLVAYNDFSYYQYWMTWF